MWEGATAFRVEWEYISSSWKTVHVTVDRPDIGVWRHQVRVVYHVRALTVCHSGASTKDVRNKYTRHLQSARTYLTFRLTTTTSHEYMMYSIFLLNLNLVSFYSVIDTFLYQQCSCLYYAVSTRVRQHTIVWSGTLNCFLTFWPSNLTLNHILYAT